MGVKLDADIVFIPSLETYILTRVYVFTFLFGCRAAKCSARNGTFTDAAGIVCGAGSM